MTNKELANQLRQIADIYEQNPEIVQPHEVQYESSNIYCHNPADWHATVRAFGCGKKSADEDKLIFKPADIAFVRIMGFKSGVCDRVVLGSEEVPDVVIPAQAEIVIPGGTREIVEYRCRPFTEYADVEESAA